MSDGVAKDLSGYRASKGERERMADLFGHVPAMGASALDVGARDGHLSKELATRFEAVTALDLEVPVISHPRIRCVRGDVTRMEFEDGSFDVVLCAEVLEHVPPGSLRQACAEIVRVTRGVAVIGVPYREDLRVGRMHCQRCGHLNPSWGHVNCFDESRLEELFFGLTIARTSFVGTSTSKTNPVSTILMDFAGNPFGTWDQDEPCINCHEPLGKPKERNFLQRVASRLAVVLDRAQERFTRPQPNWIHVSFAKTPNGASSGQMVGGVKPR